MIAFGVLGIINLHSGFYVMVVKRRILVGLLDGHTIYKVAEPAIFRVSNKGSKDVRDEIDSASASSSNQKSDAGDRVRQNIGFFCALGTGLSVETKFLLRLCKKNSLGTFLFWSIPLFTFQRS